jgi:ribosomal-protein-alanine N-acetyltransferase
MTLADVPVVGALEPRCFPAPWSAQTYRNELLHNQYSAYFVLRPAGDGKLPSVLAYGGYWLMGDEAHIVTLATHPDFRRQGLGEQLLLGLVDRARRAGARSVTLEVRVSNKAAQALYAKWGFVVVGQRRGYYQDNGEDAILMTRFFDA